MARRGRAGSIRDDIQANFEVGRYDVCRKWDTRQWYAALRRRYGLFLAAALSKKAIQMREIVIALMRDPERSAEGLDSSAEYVAVREPTLYEVWSIAARIRTLDKAREACEARDRWWEDQLPTIDMAKYDFEWPERGFADELARKVFVEPGLSVLGQHSPLISISLGAPDEVILHHVKLWLAHVRQDEAEKYRSVKRTTESEQRKWAQLRLLPYLDLTLLAQAHGARIPQYEIGAYLYPDGRDFDVAERIRKVVQPKANRLMTSAQMQALEWTAKAVRVAERN